MQWNRLVCLSVMTPGCRTGNSRCCLIVDIRGGDPARWNTARFWSVNRVPMVTGPRFLQELPVMKDFEACFPILQMI